RPSLLPLSRLQTKNGQMRIRGGGEALQRKVTLDERWFHARPRPFIAEYDPRRAEMQMHISGVLRQPAGEHPSPLSSSPCKRGASYNLALDSRFRGNDEKQHDGCARKKGGASRHRPFPVFSKREA
ncbi:MAG: hypothetical protein WCY92_13305, partial [Novosphingobium sp.]